MTTRTQILRSSTPGQTPAAGSRLPGELWTTFPDLQLGVIDASKNAQKLIAVRFFSTTANYAAGDFVIQAGVLYAAKGAITAGAFNATQWARLGSATDPSGPYLALAGGTLTGALTLNADPGVALGAATKQYVDGKVTAAPYLPIAGGTLTGPVILSGPPTVPLHAATKAYVDAGAFVPIGGGTMTGDLVLNRDPVVALGAATKQSVDARGAGDNRIINGDMRIDQRNNGASGTAVQVYTVDRWKYNTLVTAKGNWQRANSACPGFPYHLAFSSTSAYTAAAADFFMWLHAVEGDMVSDLQWGTANAQPVTLSFWVYVSQPGTYGGSIRNATSDRAYPFSFVPTANAWTKIVVTIPGDTTGTWTLSGNGVGLYLAFDLGSGSNYKATANVWNASGAAGVTGGVNVVATNGAFFYLSGVKLETGSVATPFNRQSLAKSMADCQRYYQAAWMLISVSNQIAASPLQTVVNFPVVMRASPTIAVISNSNVNYGSFALPANPAQVWNTGAVVANGAAAINTTLSASAEL